MKAFKTEKKTECQTCNRTKAVQDSVGHKHKIGPDFVGLGYHPPERFVPLVRKFSYPANATRRAQLFNQLQRHYGNRYVQRVVSAYRSKNGKEDEHKLAPETLSRKGSGRPLEPEVREFMEPRFGYDFSHVRVHTDTYAARKSNELNAVAFTVGRDIFFNEGRYNTSTAEGKRLLAHELTHVVQQRGITMHGEVKVETGVPNNAYEKEADHAADVIVTGLPVRVPLHAGGISYPLIQRQATVRRGSVGCPVPELQEKLNVTGEGLNVDGIFGPLTEAAVRRFQGAHPPLIVDSVVGPLTWTALHAAAPGNHGLPSGEITNTHGWGTGNLATIHRWRQQLQPTTTRFQNCRVTEADPGGGTDTCWFPGSAFLPFNAVTGGTWNVGPNNFWGDDFVGWFAPAVTYYRAQGRAPCRASFPQSMRVVRPDGDVEYVRHQLVATIEATSVSSTRAGQRAIRRWP